MRFVFLINLKRRIRIKKLNLQFSSLQNWKEKSNNQLKIIILQKSKINNLKNNKDTFENTNRKVSLSSKNEEKIHSHSNFAYINN